MRQYPVKSSPARSGSRRSVIFALSSQSGLLTDKMTIRKSLPLSNGASSPMMRFDSRHHAYFRINTIRQKRYSDVSLGSKPVSINKRSTEFRKGSTLNPTRDARC